MNCNHPQTEVRKQRFVNGRWHLRRQCLCCGQLVGKYLPQDGVDMNAALPVDYALMEAKDQQKRAVRAEHLAQGKLNRHLEYENYLRTSPNWQRLRTAVLKRDEYVCRGCLIDPATQVHHTTYEHVFNELAWELVAVCRTCHERAHGLYQAERATVTIAEGF